MSKQKRTNGFDLGKREMGGLRLKLSVEGREWSGLYSPKSPSMGDSLFRRFGKLSFTKSRQSSYADICNF
ncbi:hypothetical protein U1Q18_000696 [Sarracenia purpurea var. burkii]